MSFFLSLLAQLVQLCTGVILTWIAVSFLTAEELPVWFMFVSFLPLVNITDFGVSTVIARHSSRLSGSGVNVAEFIRALVFPPLIFLSLACAVAIAMMLHSRGTLSAVASITLVIGFCLRVCFNLAIAPVCAAGNFIVEKTARILSSVVLFVFAYYWAAASRLEGIAYAYVAHSVVGLLALAAIYLLVYRVSPQLLVPPSVSIVRQYWMMYRADIVDALLTSIPALVLFQVSVWVLFVLKGPADVPSLSVVLQIAFAAISVATIPVALTGPFIGRSKGRRNVQEIAHFVTNASSLSTALVAFVALSIYMYFGIIDEIWLKGRISIEGGLLPLALAFVLLEVLAISMTLPCYFYSAAHFAAITWMSAVVHFVLMWPTIFYLGASGALLSLLIAQICTIYWYNARRFVETFGIPLLAYLKLVARPMLVTIVICGSFAAMTLNAFGKKSVWAVLISELSAALVAMVTIKKLRLVDTKTYLESVRYVRGT